MSICLLLVLCHNPGDATAYIIWCGPNQTSARAGCEFSRPVLLSGLCSDMGCVNGLLYCQWSAVLDASAVDGAESLVIVALIRGGGGEGDKSRARVDLPSQVRVSPVHCVQCILPVVGGLRHSAGRAGQRVGVGWVLASEC